jgi:hypothetical protein
MTLNRPELDNGILAGIGLRLVLGLPLLIWVSHAWGWEYVNFWLPWYREVLGFVLPDYAVTSLALIWQKGEWHISGEFVTERLMFVHGEFLPAGAGVSASTLMAHALKPPLILAAAVLVWPGLTLLERVGRLLLSLLFLPVLSTLDVPLVLASAVNDLMSWLASPQADAASTLVDWSKVLDGGGRMALGIAAAFATAGVHGWLVRSYHAWFKRRRRFPAGV